MTRVLFIAAHRPNRSPSQRFRFEQYFSYLHQNGIECELSYIINEKDDKLLYAEGKFFQKFLLLLKSYFKRWKDVMRSKKYDLIFVQREAIMTHTTRFERMFKRKGNKLIFDFDDAIWMLDVSEGNKKLKWLKNPQKTSKLIKIADLVIAGNQYLADYARQFNPNITIIPTTVDTDLFQPGKNKKPASPLTIGWSGSITTIKHFIEVVPVLTALKKKYGNAIQFKVIGDATYHNEELNIQGIPWNANTEVDDLRTIDIGIMPLPTDEWTKGKCGLKGLTYMALEIPTVMSAIGVNTEIIQHEVNGFIPVGEKAWFEVLCRLIESPELRQKIGQAGRVTVVEKYSVHSQKEKYLKIIQQLMQS